MTKKRDAKGQLRDYAKEYREYHAKPAQRQRRSERTMARNEAIKKGRVKRGDGKELDHVGYHPTGSLKDVPTRVTSRRANRKRQPPKKGYNK